MLKLVESDNGVDDEGRACSAEGNGSDEEGNGSTGPEDTGCGIEDAVSGAGGSCAEGSDAVCADGAGSLDGSVGSDQGGRATSSMDSCACIPRTTAKNITATRAGVLPMIKWAKRWMYRA